MSNCKKYSIIKVVDIVLIGVGVRKDYDCFYLFEKLVNVVHQYATTAKVCFNIGPTDSVQAVQR
ncbi:hypothetical protein [Francisella orientalis]|uniref:Uncharacterized protein n=1 Tax=Francisella orientalis TaxID=299583 RepID=A0AAP7FVD8_9GAMM|nr:hypothetical protein [Francisella orientalis]APD41384.1 hypothetical protein BMT43_05180 [Francisella orientalis]ASU11167.1 hypothetical protein FNO01_1057a [Francisella orientalis]ASV63833.1 hypothetical protein FNO12_1057a [Francisella orientalis FNO12]ASV63848.1 hypothetical protein FNO24_1059a [Francisella orientalis FNO24]ASV63866.1 hypothetical protein FNO190_1057a [Francisella orientalis]